MKHANIIRSEQIEECLRHAPTAVIGGMANAFLASACMWSSGWHLPILAWLGAICLCGTWRIGMYLSHRRSHPRSHRDHGSDSRAVRSIEWVTLANGMVWGIGIALAAMVASPGQFTILAALSGGMMGAAILTHGSMARAALLFIVPIAGGTVVAWTIHPQASGLVGLLLAGNYLAMLGRGALNQQSQFARRIEAREELRDAGATVQLLLNEFEAQSADWLWEIDRDGRIVGPSARFAEAAGQPIALLESKPFISLFDDSADLERLELNLADGRAFRSCACQLTIAGATHWWLLSARPAANGAMRGLASDITSQRKAEARASHMAQFDSLTGLANRYAFNARLELALAGGACKAGKVAILCLDLDRFKSVNDSLGHPIGDRLLCEAARRIEQIVRSADLVARLGGDEFAILIEDVAALATADHIAQRIVDAMKLPFVLDNMQILTGASIGISVAGEGESKGAGGGESDATIMQKRADLALYQAKALGRNQFTHFAPGMDEVVREKRNLEIELRTALAENQFVLAYEPVIDTASGLTVSCEALLRWHHPARGLVMPNDFIAIAEETGLIVPLGEWVIREATAELARWPRHMQIAVNLSPVQLQNANLVAMVMQAIAAAGIEPHRLELEITENVFLLDNVVNSGVLHQLKAIGVRIALDDFGTGYSSLNYLRSFPFDKIKIDRCFISEVAERDDCRNIVRTIIGLARALGMVTTAEGVERQEQFDWLKAEGCTQAQGYLFKDLGFGPGARRSDAGTISRLHPIPGRPDKAAHAADHKPATAPFASAAIQPIAQPRRASQ
jgi:diguanylate cyclase (GGDEF)-like protein